MTETAKPAEKRQASRVAPRPVTSGGLDLEELEDAVFAAAEYRAAGACGAVGHDDGADSWASADKARRRALLEETDRYLAELIQEVGEPSPEEVAEAEAWADRIERALKKARTAE